MTEKDIYDALNERLRKCAEQENELACVEEQLKILEDENKALSDLVVGFGSLIGILGPSLNGSEEDRQRAYSMYRKFMLSMHKLLGDKP